MDTNKIEKALLDRELKELSEKLGKIGSEIREAFNKYGTIKCEHAEELHKYIVTKITGAGTHYYAGYTTAPQTNAHPDHVPEIIKELVLSWAVKNFFDHFDEMREIADSIEL